MYRLIVLFFCCLTHVAGPLWAQNTVFEKITIDQGLSQGMIFDILQTRDGFLWVATKDGLNRYDGYNFKVFTNNPFDSFSISGNSAAKLFEDSRGLLWVGLNAKGLDVYVPDNGRFHHFPIAFNDSKIFNSTETTAIAEATDGSIWFAQRSGDLWRIAVPADWQNALFTDATSKSVQATLVPTPFERNFNNGFSSESALDILRLSDGTMLVTTTYRQFAFDPKTLAFQPINKQLLGEPGVNFQFPACSIHDPAGDEDSWFYRVSGSGHTLSLVRIRHGQATSYPLPPPPLVYRLVRGAGGHNWVVLNGNIWDLMPGEAFDVAKPDFKLEQNGTCFELDRAGNLWLGTDGYGLRKFTPTKQHFQAGAAGNSLGRIWTNGGRYFVKKTFWIYAFDPRTGRLSENPVFGNAPMRQVHLAFEPSGAAWLMGNIPEVPSGSLYHYSPDNFTQPDKKYDFRAITLNEADPMLYARDRRLYIATGNWRLIRFDPQTENFDYFDYSHLFGKQVNAIAPFRWWRMQRV